jgi:hypothetical protein
MANFLLHMLRLEYVPQHSLCLNVAADERDLLSGNNTWWKHGDSSAGLLKNLL